MKPPVAIFENVLTARTSDNWTRAIARLNANGYHSVSVCLDACKMNINVPQTRKRLFVVLCRTSGQDLTVAHKMNEWLEQCKTMMRSRSVTSIEQAIPEMKNKTLFVFPRRRENQCVFASDRPAPCIRSMILAKPSGSRSCRTTRSTRARSTRQSFRTSRSRHNCVGFPSDFKFGPYKVHNGLALGQRGRPGDGSVCSTVCQGIDSVCGRRD